MLRSPSSLFLDEPTIGLHAVSKLAVRDFVTDFRGVTVSLSTHDMDDIKALCEQLIAIGKSRMLLDGTLASLRACVSRERTLVAEALS